MSNKVQINCNKANKIRVEVLNYTRKKIQECKEEKRMYQDAIIKEEIELMILKEVDPKWEEYLDLWDNPKFAIEYFTECLNEIEKRIIHHSNRHRRMASKLSMFTC